jgi:chromosome partitioning protein
VTRTVTLANQKGGVAKTTTAINLGGVLGDRGHRVLLVDIDPQGNATLHSGLRPDDQPTLWPLLQEVGISTRTQTGDFHEVLESLWDQHVIDPEQVPIVSHPNDNPFDLVPANLELSDADLVLSSAVSRERCLAVILNAVKEPYDYVFIDCAPHLGVLTLNAMTAADSLLIPLQAAFFASNGMNQLFRFYKKVRDTVNSSLDILGVLITQVDSRTVHSTQIAQQARNALAGRVRVFETEVPQNVDLADASAAGKCITHFAPRSAGAKAYTNLAIEIEAVTNDS